MKEKLSVPVLLLTFNRPQKTKQVFDRIRQVQPKTLYLAADGPREGTEDGAKTEEVREILSKVDWDCDVKRLYQEANLGCKMGVNAAIDWFFDNEEMGIILEDDTLPDISFFNFAQECLHRYRDDSRVMMICAHNHLGTWSDNSSSYFFSQLGAIWGWASWRRAWNLNDQSVESWEVAKRERIFDKIFSTQAQAAHRLKVTDATMRQEIDTWDYIWTMNRLINSGLSVVPAHNLMTNIGFDQEATHTTGKALPSYAMKSRSLGDGELVHPPYVYPDYEFDQRVFEENHNKHNAKRKMSLKRKVIGGLKSMAGRAQFDEAQRQSEKFFFQQKCFNQIQPLLNQFSSYLPISNSALSYGCLAHLANDVTINGRNNIIEFGSGISTLLLAMLVKTNNLSAKITSFDHNEEWIDHLRRILKANDVGSTVEFSYVPIKSHTNLWYDGDGVKSTMAALKDVDCVIVDGPEAWEKGKEHARQYALQYFREHLADTFSIFVDDIWRSAELQMAKDWSTQLDCSMKAYYEDFAILSKGHGYNIKV